MILIVIKISDLNQADLNRPTLAIAALVTPLHWIQLGELVQAMKFCNIESRVRKLPSTYDASVLRRLWQKAVKQFGLQLWNIS